MAQRTQEPHSDTTRGGYPDFAHWMAQPSGHKTTFVFRRFDKLAARNLLHLQAQLTALEEDIDDLDGEAAISPDSDTIESLRRYETLLQRSRDASPSENVENELLDKFAYLESLLARYRALFIPRTLSRSLIPPGEAICLQAHMDTLAPPDARALHVIRGIIDGNLPGDFTTPLIRGLVAQNYMRHTHDFLTLSKVEKVQFLPRLLGLDIVGDNGTYTTVLVIVPLVAAMVHIHRLADLSMKFRSMAFYMICVAPAMLVCSNVTRENVFTIIRIYAAAFLVFVYFDICDVQGGVCMV